MNIFTFFLLFLFIYFCGVFYIINIGGFLSLDFLNKYIDLNIGDENTFSGDLKNASLYLFAAQATLIGLVFPIVIAYVSLANEGRARSDILMKIYKSHTGFSALANSLFLLLASYASLFVLDSFFNIYLFKLSQFFFLIWFLINIYIIYIFLTKTLDFVDGFKKIEEVKKFSYNNKDGVGDGFLVILDELKYFIEKKSISRVEELEINIVDFLEINYIKHGFNSGNIKFFLSEIRILIDSTLDYNDTHSIRKMLYIYYYIGGRLLRNGGGVFLKDILEINYAIIFNVNNKLNLGDGFKNYVFSKFLDSWSSWKYVIKDNDGKVYYAYATFMVLSFFVINNIKIDFILDIFLKIPEDAQDEWYENGNYKIFNKIEKVSDQMLINHCIDLKFCLIKNIIDSQIELNCKREYVKKVLKNTSPLTGTAPIRANTRIVSTDDLIFSLIRLIYNPIYTEYINDMFDRSKPSDRMVNRLYMVDTRSYLSKLSETYACIFDQFISNKKYSNFMLNSFLDVLDVKERVSLAIKIDEYISELNNIEFNFDFFTERKSKNIKSDFLILIETLRDDIFLNINLYYSNFVISDYVKGNIFYNQFNQVYSCLNSSLFSKFVIWKNQVSNPEGIRLDCELDFEFEDLDSNLVVRGNENFIEINFIDQIMNLASTHEEKSEHPILEMLKFAKKEVSEDQIFLVFCLSFFKDINNENFNLSYRNIGFDTFLINGVVFKFIRGFDSDFYGICFNNKLVSSIEVLCGNEILKNSSLTLVSLPPPNFSLHYKLIYDFLYKININSNYFISAFSRL
ncbi:hypothetical protein [Acinetobacter sp. NBRC 100985]|uniref:hypothetical protein n=1 Tax=Acinetobacter sp. NBRC 100985 TaxID=1071390 RepID=UPI000235F9F1|nr:hypothetical protein [Acinetobacter sp. NBRC 100985]GAB02639.1 hypothetical protein ACT4_035_00220 [Acinetobacter sp. NBRC 100985]